MRAAGYEPLAVYPGRTATAWRAECMKCGAVRRPTLNKVRLGARCSHRSATMKNYRPRVPVAARVAEMRAAGYRPLVKYPGYVTLVWKSECVRCGAVRHPSLSKVRAGQRCLHGGRLSA